MTSEVRLEIGQDVNQMAVAASNAMRRLPADQLQKMLAGLEVPKKRIARAACVEHLLKLIGLSYVAAIDAANAQRTESAS